MPHESVTVTSAEKAIMFDDTRPYRQTIIMVVGRWNSFYEKDILFLDLDYTLIIGKPMPRSVKSGQDLVLDMDRALETESGADVTINCKDGSFKAIKVLLSTRSEVRS